MDTNAWAIIGTILAVFAALWRYIAAVERRFDRRFEVLGDQMGSLRERMAKLEGLLEGLREAVTGKHAT